jgi:homoserine dehydrogenase
MALDKPGVLAAIAGVLARFGISIASVTQKERKKQEAVPIVMITHEACEKSLKKALESIDRLGAIKEKSIAIRIEEV